MKTAIEEGHAVLSLLLDPMRSCIEETTSMAVAAPPLGRRRPALVRRLRGDGS